MLVTKVYILMESIEPIKCPVSSCVAPLQTDASMGVGIKGGTRNMHREPKCYLFWRFRMVREDTGAPNESATCACMESNEAVSCTIVAAVAEWYRYRTVACFVTGSSPVPLKTRRVGQRCMLNLSRAETSSRWCGVVVRRGGCQLRCRPRHLTMVQNYVVSRQKPSCS
ncbi:uncharacterized protein TNCV_2240401 [Trichonephila clavipes]|nr:uncharacterized protein TNCV_2240401 [Trichonephila clavipes]